MCLTESEMTLMGKLLSSQISINTEGIQTGTLYGYNRTTAPSPINPPCFNKNLFEERSFVFGNLSWLAFLNLSVVDIKYDSSYPRNKEDFLVTRVRGIV